MDNSNSVSLINEICNDLSDNDQSSNFNLMIDRTKYYISIVPHQKKVLNKFLENHLLAVLTNFIHQLMIPELTFDHPTDSYYWNRADDSLNEFSIIDGKRNGVTTYYEVTNDNDSKIRIINGRKYKASGTTHYLNNKFHRDDGPAIDGNIKSWYQNWKLHRTDGPAIEYSNGDKQYYRNHKCHREDGPAMDNQAIAFGGSGDKQWWVHGKRHREDGFAVEYPGHEKYFMYDILQTKIDLTS